MGIGYYLGNIEICQNDKNQHGQNKDYSEYGLRLDCLQASPYVLPGFVQSHSDKEDHKVEYQHRQYNGDFTLQHRMTVKRPGHCAKHQCNVKQAALQSRH